VLQAFYLASHFGEHEVQLHADDLAPSSGRFRILRAGTESNLKFERFDLIVNCRSLMEMSQLQINQYFSLIHNVCPVGGCFYNLNRYLKTSNGYRNAIGRYPYDPRWNILGVAPSPLQPQLLELVTSRTSRPNPFFGPFLLTIPRSNLWWDRSLGTALEAISPLGHRLLLRDLPRFASRTRRLVRRALRREGPTISRSAGWTST
jgi:hypothetical protein